LYCEKQHKKGMAVLSLGLYFEKQHKKGMVVLSLGLYFEKQQNEPKFGGKHLWKVLY
jgi:hypothetical protein